MDRMKNYHTPTIHITRINTEKPLALSLNDGGADPEYGMDAKERNIGFEDGTNTEKKQWKDGLW